MLAPAYAYRIRARAGAANEYHGAAGTVVLREVSGGALDRDMLRFKRRPSPRAIAHLSKWEALATVYTAVITKATPRALTRRRVMTTSYGSSSERHQTCRHPH